MVKRIKEIEKEDRPREKLLRIGAKNLTDKELLAILLRTGSKNQNVIELADTILKNNGGIFNLKHLTYNELIKYKGVGQVKALDILTAVEFAKRVFTEKKDDKLIFNNLSLIANYFRYKLQEEKQELFIVVDLDSRGKVIEEREVFKGTLASSVAHPREIFKNAIKNSASSIVCIHNHPSGDAQASFEDVIFTKKLIDAGNVVGIELLDHIVIAKNGYFSIYKFLNFIDVENIDINFIEEDKITKLTKKYNLINKYDV